MCEQGFQLNLLASSFCKPEIYLSDYIYEFYNAPFRKPKVQNHAVIHFGNRSVNLSDYILAREPFLIEQSIKLLSGSPEVSKQGSFYQAFDLFRICGCSSPVNGFPGNRFFRINESSSLKRIYSFSHVSLGHIYKGFISVLSNR